MIGIVGDAIAVRKKIPRAAAGCVAISARASDGRASGHPRSRAFAAAGAAIVHIGIEIGAIHRRSVGVARRLRRRTRTLAPAFGAYFADGAFDAFLSAAVV